MDKDKIKDVIEKYEAGKSTIQEEQFLFENAKDTDGANEAWSAYVNQKKMKAPKNFEASLWGAIEAKKNENTKIQDSPYFGCRCRVDFCGVLT